MSVLLTTLPVQRLVLRHPMVLLNEGTAPCRDGTIRRIRQVLIKEWRHFGCQIVQGKNVLHKGAKGSDRGYYKRVGTYWRESTGHKFDGRDTDEYWSSAFISWVMQQAGVPESEFAPTRRHSKYIYDALQNTHGGRSDAMFQGRRLSEYAPKPGDLIAYSMSGWMKTYDRARKHWKYRSHGDIVVHTGPGVIWSIGGNVKGGVSLSVFKTDGRGYLEPGLNIQRLFVAIENRLPYE